ncbi:glycosyltransferase family A protein [Fictibacillus sp. b24]|uniref:glycosyltransferase family A protein n=1 Tax=Fictibacillus sp. b24 TaxID=3055863 RepID=UPI0025A09099|nr:glycosyltransferase family A protein [Fictibacillus sp. b24]MDM5316744.1 glycosyltransferase family A protein [Fictibacillus sp. b24]
MVSIITCTMRDHCMENIFQNYLNQSYEPKELIIILNHDCMNINKWKEKALAFKNVSVYQLQQDTSLGSCINFAIEKAKFDLIANFDDDDYYSSHYLEKSVENLHKLNVDVIGKTSVYIYLKDRQILAVFNPNNENQFVNDQKSFGKQYLQGGTLVFKKKVHEIVKFPDQIKEVDRVFSMDCVKRGFKVYSSNKDEFVYIRCDDEGQHTWQVPIDIIINVSKFIANTKNFKEIL